MTIANAKDPAAQAKLLQSCVASSIDLALNMKQLHWNIRGPKFRSIHEFLDVIIDHARNATDVMAERMATIGQASIGQRATLQESALPKLPDDFVSDEAVIAHGSEALDHTIATLRDAREKVADIDAVTEDIIIGILADLEKDLWMLRSHAL